ncbi:decapping and exoribonuclease protein Rai1-like isoform 4-T6 [Cochliomyia hominivorax]
MISCMFQIFKTRRYPYQAQILKSKAENKCHEYRKKTEIHFSNIRIVSYYERQGTRIARAKSIRYFITPPAEIFPIDLNVGYEEYLNTANVIPDIKKPWNEKIEFLGVFQSDLGKFDILYNGSIHAILSEEEFKEFDNMDEFNKCRFVLVKQMWKTSPHKFKKLFKYLYMAYLTKVNDIFVAYKDANGVVREPLEHKLLSHFSHFELKQLWSSEAFLLDFLCRIEKLMSDINCLDTVYVISNNGHNFYYKIYEGKTNKSFIPQFYQDHVKNKANI